MPIDVMWTNDDQDIYLVHYWGDVTAGDMSAAFITTSEMIFQTQPRIDGIVIFDPVFRLPKDFAKHRSRLWQYWPPNLGKLVYTGNRFGWEVVTVYQDKFTTHNWDLPYVPTFDAALNSIYADRAKP
jgi:hypothetical protein